MNKQNCTSLITTCLFSRIRSLKKLITVFTYLLPETRLLVTPAIEAQLNERQKVIINYVLENGSVTSGWCRERFNVAYQTVYRDLNGLKDLGILKQEGAGRSTGYVMSRGNE